MAARSDGRKGGDEREEAMTFNEFDKAAPGAVAALRALGQCVDASGLEKTLTELMKVRVSQINGCAFCIQFHLNLARKLGVPAQKLDLVAAWRDVDVYSDRERAALTYAEVATRDPGAAAHALAEARTIFSQSESIMLAVSVATINQWNRIAAPLLFPPPAAS